MTYCIEQIKRTYSNETLTELWWPIDWFEDRDLARKELANLIKAWGGQFRLIEVEK